MLLDLLFGLILVLLIGLGAWRGAVASAVGLASLVAGYAGAIAAATWASAPLGALLDVPGMAAPAVAGTLGFAVAWLCASAVGDVAVAWDEERVEAGARGIADRMVGGGVGLVRGGFVVVLLALLVSWLDAARDLGAAPGLAAMPDAAGSSAVAVSGAVVERVVAGALAESGSAGQVAARITARPSESISSVQALLEDPRLMGLFEDELFWTLMTNDSVDHAMNRAAIRAVIDDADLRGRFVGLGLVSAEAGQDPVRFRRAIAAVFEEIAPKIHGLQHDPELNQIAQDPEIVALIESGDLMALARHPSIRHLVDRVSTP